MAMSQHDVYLRTTILKAQAEEVVVREVVYAE